MPVPSSISDLSTTPSLNSPAGTESPSTVDDYLRTFAAFIKQVDGGAVKAAGLAAPGGSALVGYTPAGTGAVATDVQSKLRESVSVKDFGADPTGSVDSYQAFVKAFAANNYVHAPAGTYIIDGLLQLNGKHLIGDGVGITVLKRGASTLNINLIEINNGSIRDLSVDGNKNNLTNYATLNNVQLGSELVCYSGTPSVFGKDVLIRNIKITNSQSSCIAGSWFENVQIENVILGGFDDHAIYFSTGCQDLNIKGVRFTGDCSGNPDNYAIQFRQGVRNVLIDGVTQEGNEADFSSVTIAGLLSVSNNDIGLSDYYNSCRNITVRNVAINLSGPQLFNIVQRAPGGTISGVLLEDWTVYGSATSYVTSFAQGNVANNSVRDVTFNNCKFYGFSFLHGGADFTTDGIRFVNCDITYRDYVAGIGSLVTDVVYENMNATPVSMAAGSAPFTVNSGFDNVVIRGGKITAPTGKYIFDEPTGAKNSMRYFDYATVLQVDGAHLITDTGVVGLRSAPANAGQVNGAFIISNTVEEAGTDNIHASYRKVMNFTNRAKHTSGVATSIDSGWTPTVTAGGGTITASVTSAAFYRSGRIAVATGEVTMTAFTGTSGAINISLPVVAGAQVATAAIRQGGNWGATVDRVQGIVDSGSISLALTRLKSGAETFDLAAQYSGAVSLTLRFTVTYLVA